MKYFEKELQENVNKNNIQGLIEVYKRELNDKILEDIKNQCFKYKNIRKSIIEEIFENKLKSTILLSDIEEVQKAYSEIENFMMMKYSNLRNKLSGLKENEDALLPNQLLYELIEKILKETNKKYIFSVLNNSCQNFDTIAYLYLLNNKHHIYDFEFINLIIEETLLNKAKNNIMWLNRQELMIGAMSTIKPFLDFENEDPIDLNYLISETLNDVISKKTMWLKNEDDDAYKYTNKKIFFQFKDIIKKLNSMKNNVSDVTVSDEDILKVEEELGVAFNNGQKEAIIKSIQSPVILLSGEAGTGKTTVAKGILKMLKNKHIDELKIFGGAFTGKASQHLGKELNLRQTTTISKDNELMLEENGTLDRLIFQNRFNKKYSFNVNFGKKDFNEEEIYLKHLLDEEAVYNYHYDSEEETLQRPTPVFEELDLLIIDECSMLSVTKFHELIMNMRDDARIIMIGDIAQLPPVNDVALLNELKHTSSFVSVHLTEPMRQQGKLYSIVKQIRSSVLPKGFYQNKFLLKENNKIIIRGKGKTSNAVDDAVNDYLNTLKAIHDKFNNEVNDEINDEKLNLVLNQTSWNNESKKAILNYQKNTRALALENKDVNYFNKKVISYLLEHNFLDVRNHNVAVKGFNNERAERFYVNERVMITNNLIVENKGKNIPVKNGETGVIIDIIPKKNWNQEDELLNYQIDTIVLKMDDESIVDLSGKFIQYLTPAYAMTIHKSQGMTIDNIIMIFDSNFGSRELIYTGISRTKKQLTLFCNAYKLEKALQNSVYNKERVLHPYF